MGDRPKVALIAGPTASGKSALALALAERTGGVIVNADASQVYRDLRVLSARPSPGEEARAEHRLFGHVDGAVAYSAAAWAAAARAAIAAAHDAGMPAILVGGTGLYIRTLLDGIAPVPEIDPEVRATVRTLPILEAHAALGREDPDAAARLPSTDSARIARALEVVRSTGRTLADWQRNKAGGIGGTVDLAPLVLLPPRDWLRARCDARFEAMLASGAIEEVEALGERALDARLPVMRAIGVREIIAWRAGTTDRATMIAAAQAATRQYAKRQYTWLTHQPPAHWTRHNEQLDTVDKRNIVIKLLIYSLTR
ncbi:MAG: tRNA (adenosine(37)-N6)-dimethylallyltransferase MiaA [Sphingomonadaceae bacterium]|nr:tRNA (adenosine(37)-N6)-dimethylallyltransferase MiaA [Sphingomonadaceae bacterium]